MSNYVNLMDIIYPIGSIYISTNSTSPAATIGGTWNCINDSFYPASVKSDWDWSAEDKSIISTFKHIKINNIDFALFSISETFNNWKNNDYNVVSNTTFNGFRSLNLLGNSINLAAPKLAVASSPVVARYNHNGNNKIAIYNSTKPQYYGGTFVIPHMIEDSTKAYIWKRTA